MKPTSKNHKINALILLISLYILHAYVLLKVDWKGNHGTPIFLLVLLAIYYHFLFHYKITGEIQRTSQKDACLKPINTSLIAVMFIIIIWQECLTGSFDVKNIPLLLLTIIVDILLPEQLLKLLSNDRTDDNNDNNTTEKSNAPDFSPSQ